MSMNRPIYSIADEIVRTWTKPYFGAIPYIKAMQLLSTRDCMYGLDSAEEIVLRFLANAGTWRGEDARRIKQELKGLIK